jgi:D-proline reductase (dithiol) PrdB
MADERLRAAAVDQPVPEFEKAPRTSPPPLAQARVALVTTAALHDPVDETIRGGDQSFRLIEASQPVVLGHGSPNFDRSGWLADPNVVFPVDRLGELARAGRIGSVASRHISFAGNQPDVTLSTLRLDSGPAAAGLLREDGVHVVLITGI